MNEDLVFRMGEYEAPIPSGRLYTHSHLWLQGTPASYRTGLTAYAVRLLYDVYFLDWSVQPPVQVGAKQEMGEIESSKALSTLFAPADGCVLELNERLLDDPSIINTDTYGGGWLYRFKTDAKLLTPQQYLDHLTDNWDETKRRLNRGII